MKALDLFRVARGGIALAAVALLSLGVHANGASAAASSPTVTAATAVTPNTGLLPSAGAPSGTTFDLSTVGYQASEFFLSGMAASYHNVVGPPFLADGLWTIAADATTAAYNTRIQVYRPINSGDFNGTVFVEWLNVTNLSDSAPDWIYAHNEMIREGAAYVGVTAQKNGVTAATGGFAGFGIPGNPARYGPTGVNLVHPGDSFSYDIFSQAGQAVRDNPALILGGLTPTKVIATGESQSASRMVTYVDAVHPLVTVYDGYLVHSRGSTGSQLRGSPPGTINVPGPTLMRTDLGVPVFVFQTETDTRGTRQADTSIFRQWEVAGSAHADIYTLGIGQPDEGMDDTASLALFGAMRVPVTTPLPGILAPCTFGVNSGPHHWALQAAVHWLNLWVTSSALPPTGGPGLTTTGIPTAPLVLDGNLNATGGVRSPHVDAAVATIRGTGNTSAGAGTNFCGLFGTTTALTTAQIQALYTKQSLFVAAWNQDTDNAVGNGWILPADAPTVKFPAAATQVVPKIALSVTADDETILLGAADPTFTAAITGFVLGDTAAVLDTPPTCDVAGPHTAPGSYPITCSGGADDDYSFGYTSGTLNVRYAFGGFLQPIDADGSSLFKLKSTVPVKFQLSDANGAQVATANATLTTAKISNGVVGTDVEAVSTSAATTGNAFRYDPDAQQYIFNLSTKELTKGTYQLTASLDDGTHHSVIISLR